MKEVQYLEQLLVSGKINRREFIGKLVAMGVSVTMASSIFTQSEASAASTPKRGGRFRIGCTTGSTSDTLDPRTLKTTMPIGLNLQLRNYLVEVDHTGAAIPELAESWEPSPDARVWAFNIRKNVQFHNGKTLDANDVAFSINLHRGEKTASVGKALASAISDITVEGKNKVIFTLKNGNADFPYLLSEYSFSIVPDGTTDFDAGIGTGPYMLRKFEPGVRSLTVRNPNYWKSDRAWFDEIEVFHLGDANTRTSALMTGKVDYVDRLDPKTAGLLKKRKNMQVVVYGGLKLQEFAMLTDIAPFDNPDVRLAMKYGIDREEMVAKILRGYGRVGNDHPISSQVKYSATSIPQRSYDPDKARYHWKKSGLGNQSIQLHAAPKAFPGAMDASALYKESLSKAGITLDVIREASDGYWSNVWLKKPFCACAWSGRVTADLMLTVAFLSTAPWNHTHWRKPEFDDTLIKARVELDDKKRAQMYFDLQKMLHDDGGTVIPMFADYVEGASDKVGFGKISGRYEQDGTRAHERWWFKS